MSSSFCKLIIRIAGKWFCLIFYSLIVSYFISTGPNVDLLCLWQSDAAPFCENYAKLYFDVKHLEKGLNRGWWNFWWLLFKIKSALFGQYWTMPWFSRLGPNLLLCGCKEKKMKRASSPVYIGPSRPISAITTHVWRLKRLEAWLIKDQVFF